MVGVMGAIMGGLSSGLREGAKDAQAQLDGADGVTLIRNAEELTSAVNAWGSGGTSLASSSK